MKKILLGLATSAFMFSVSMAKGGVNIVAIDSIEIMQKSKEGKKLSEEVQVKINDYQNFVKKAQEELTVLEKELSDKKDVLKKDALAEKQTNLENKRKQLGGSVQQQEEALRLEIQSKQVQLRNKQMAVTSKVCETSNWGLLIDKNTPGVLFASSAIDKTSDVLKRIDADYDSAVKKSTTATLASAAIKEAPKKA